MSQDAKDRMIRKLVREHMSTDKPLTQVDRVVLVFGGVPTLLQALKAVGHPRSKVTLYRWNHPRSRGGADGRIPTSALQGIVAAARHLGILLTTDLLDPRPTYADSARDIVEAAKHANEDKP